MDFPPPKTASHQDYDRLITHIDQLCPLQHFAMLGLLDSGLSWLCSHKISDTFKQQLGDDQSAISYQLSQLDEARGWCVLPIQHDLVKWLLACSPPSDLPTLRLLLECLAKRLTESQTRTHLSELPSPLIRKDPSWKKKIESINRIMRLAHTLPGSALFSQLEAVLCQMIAIDHLLLVKLTHQTLEKIHPSHPRQSDAFMSSLCHSTNPVEVNRAAHYWYSMPLRLQQQYFAHLIICAPGPLAPDDKLFLDFLRSQLTLLLELRQIRQQLHDLNSEESIHQRLQQLHQINLKLQKQLKQHQETERQLQFNALHDPLTLLPNRAQLMNHLNQAMSHYHRYKSPGFTLMFIDVDHFKQINDTLGHSAGDQLLQEISRRLQTCIRQNDLVARLGGDEFVICLDSSKNRDDISPVLNLITTRLAYPFRLADHELKITVSLGVASVDEQTTGISQLLHQADLAMYQAKRNGRDRIVHYSEVCITPPSHSPKEALASALQQGHIVPYYQPVIRLQDSHLTGLEVMARWLTDEGVVKDALDFIPLAKQCGLILELDYQILRLACQQLKQWLRLLGQRQFKVAINLSGKHLSGHEHMMRLINILAEEEVCASYLIFEFNERELSRQDAETLTLLHELRARGIQISMDDFGTGFSSLNALFHLPVDYIKVDDSFTQRMLQSPKDLALIRAMRDICQDLDYTLVVEGIENQQQLQKLIDIGCPQGQGRYISPPMPGADMVPLLAPGWAQP